MRIPFILSLFGLLLLGTNGYAGNIDVEVDIVPPDEVVALDDIVAPDNVVAGDDIVVQIESIGNDDYAIVRDLSGEIIGRQRVELPNGLRGSALVDLNAQLVNSSAASGSCDDDDDGYHETYSYSYVDGDELVTVTYTYFYDADGNLLFVVRSEIRTPISITNPTVEQ